MPATTFRPGTPCWVDLATSNGPGAQEFYGRVLGWKFETPDEATYGGYVVARLHGEYIAGIMAKSPEQEQIPDAWTTYLGVEDADATLASVTAAGGTVLLPPLDVPALGRMGLIMDPGQAVVGLWQPQGMNGFGLSGEPGAPYWHELFTGNFAPAVEFYKTAFGWETEQVSDTDQFRYATLGTGPDAVAGVYDAAALVPAQLPSHWRVYFEVEDADAAAALVTELGGTVTDGPEDTPFGRILTARDPFGATVLFAQNLRGENG